MLSRLKSQTTMQLLEEINRTLSTKSLPDVRPGDTVRVHLRIREGAKERVQVFEGLVIRRRGGQMPQASITVRRIASGVGTERVFLLHSPRIVRIQITKRSKVRRAYLTYIRSRRGKSARLQERRFDRVDMNMEAIAAEEDAQVKTPIKPTTEAPEVPGEADLTAEPAGDLGVTESAGGEPVGNEAVDADDERPVARAPEEVSEAAPSEIPTPSESETAESAASAGGSDKVTDEEITEINPEESAAVQEPNLEDTVSTEELAEEENREAELSDDDTRPDENEFPKEGVEHGLERAGNAGESPAKQLAEADEETELATRAVEAGAELDSAEDTKKD